MKTKTLILLSVLVGLCLTSVSSRALAETVVWSENFDDGNGDSRWFADNGVWQIGSPTIGPGAAHSVSNCATTGLTGNYPPLANSRLIRIQSFTVPAANQYPRLRFWQWYNFGRDDYGVVEVKVGANDWQAVSPQYFYNGGDWTYASVDLSAFAGQAVQLAFHLVGPFNSAQGWYVDDIALVTGAPVLNNPESWENGIGDWYAEAGLWQVGTPTKSGGAPTNSLGFQAHGGSNCAATVLDANYPAYPSSNSRLVSPPFTVPPASNNPNLRFWHWYSLASTGGRDDYGVVEVKAGTNDWQALTTCSGSTVIYTRNSGVWSQPCYDLSSYGEQTVQLAFRIVVASFSSGAGWYIDEVVVEADNICTYSISPTNVMVASHATNITVHVTTSNACPWTVSETTSWISVAPTNGVGSGNVVVTVAANAGSSRTGTVIIAEQPLRVIQASPTVPTVGITATDTTAIESGTNTGTFAVMRSGSTAGALRVNYTVRGTASNGVDYVTLPGFVTIPAGTNKVLITVRALDDNVFECPETVVARLATSTSYLSSPSQATVTILDEVLPTVTIVAPDPTASETLSSTGLFTIRRTGCTNIAVAVSVAISGTAINGVDYNGVDYQGISGLVVIPAGKRTTSVLVRPVQDSLAEGSQSVTLTIRNRAFYKVGTPGTATVTIADDD